MVKSLPTVQETRVWSLGQEDLLEKKMATHSSILAWKTPWTEEPGRLQSTGSRRVGHDWATSLSFLSLLFLALNRALKAILFFCCPGYFFSVVFQPLSCVWLWSHGLQHARHPCPSLWVCSNLCSLGQWCHPTISSSVFPFSSCPQFSSASRSFPRSQLFTSGGLSFGASASVPPMNIQGWFPLGLTGLISLLSKGLSRVFYFSMV